MVNASANGTGQQLRRAAGILQLSKALRLGLVVLDFKFGREINLRILQACKINGGDHDALPSGSAVLAF
jgi:hypothetical protein